jgi:hypothetical protein
VYVGIEKDVLLLNAYEARRMLMFTRQLMSLTAEINAWMMVPDVEISCLTD